MNNPNLTEGKRKSDITCYMINCQRNNLKPGEKPGDASKVKREEAGELLIDLGLSNMVIPTTSLIVSKSGKRTDNSEIKDKASIEEKAKRMEKINAIRSKKQKESGMEH